MMKQKQKTLGERLFDPRWLSNQGDARRDFKEPPVGLDLARALAARQLDSCDLGEADKANVAASLTESEGRSKTSSTACGRSLPRRSSFSRLQQQERRRERWTSATSLDVVAAPTYWPGSAVSRGGSQPRACCSPEGLSWRPGSRWPGHERRARKIGQPGPRR